MFMRTCLLILFALALPLASYALGTTATQESVSENNQAKLQISTLDAATQAVMNSMQGRVTDYNNDVTLQRNDANDEQARLDDWVEPRLNTVNTRLDGVNNIIRGVIDELNATLAQISTCGGQKKFLKNGQCIGL